MINHGGNDGLIPGSLRQSISKTTSAMSCLPILLISGNSRYSSGTAGATGAPLGLQLHRDAPKIFIFFFILASIDHTWLFHIKVASEMC